MKKRIMSILLVFVMCISVAIPVLAVDIKTLSDLTGQEYYYTYVKEMVEKGIVNGYPNGTFGGSNNITWAEALTMILRGAGVKVEPIPNTIWYEGTRQWFIKNSIIDGRDDMTAIIDRIIFVILLNKLYSVPQYEGNTVFYDTDDKDIVSFYFAGIINGYVEPTDEALGKFGPYDNIRRGDFCIIESRVINNFVLKDSIDTSDSSNLSNKDNILFKALPTFVLPEACKNANDMRDIVLWMVQNNLSEYKYEFSCTREEGEAFNQNFDDIVKDSYHDCIKNYYYMFFDKGCNVSMKGSMTSTTANLVLSISLEGNAYSRNYSYTDIMNDFEKKFIDMVVTMGVKNGMSIKEKSLSAFEYIDYILEYDMKNLKSYTMGDNTAICVGYTALFDYMMKRMGIKCESIMGDSPKTGLSETGHIWSYVFDDGGNGYYCDVTWGDPMPDGGYGFSETSWHWLTYQEMMNKDPGRTIKNSF